jgi:hypothetical protein
MPKWRSHSISSPIAAHPQASASATPRRIAGPALAAPRRTRARGACDAARASARERPARGREVERHRRELRRLQPREPHEHEVGEQRARGGTRGVGAVEPRDPPAAAAHVDCTSARTSSVSVRPSSSVIGASRPRRAPRARVRAADSSYHPRLPT